MASKRNKLNTDMENKCVQTLHFQHNSLVEFSFLPENDSSNTLILTHLNALFDRIADRKGKGIAIRADKLFRLISKTDCNQIHLERYRRMLGVERKDDKTKINGDKGYRHISRGPFLAMFKYEHLTFANSLESITRTEYVVKKKKRKKTTARLTQSGGTGGDDAGTDVSSNSVSHSTKSVPLTKTDFDEQNNGKTPNAFTSKRKQKKSKRKKIGDKTGMIILTDANDEDLSSVSISPASSTNSNETTPIENVTGKMKKAGHPLRDRKDLQNHAQSTPMSKKSKGRKSRMKRTDKKHSTPHDSTKTFRRRDRSYRKSDAIYSSDSELSEDVSFLPSSLFSGNRLPKITPEQPRPRRSRSNHSHEYEYPQNANEEYYQSQYPTDKRQYQSNSEISCRPNPYRGERINTYKEDPEIKYESLDCSFFSGLMSLFKKVLRVEEESFFISATGDEDNVAQACRHIYPPILAKSDSYDRHQQHIIKQHPFHTHQDAAQNFSSRSHQNAEIQIASSTQRITTGQHHIDNSQSFGRSKRTYDVVKSRRKHRKAQPSPSSDYYHYR